MSNQSVASVESLSPPLYSIPACFEPGNQPSLLEIEPQSSILKPEVLKRLKLAVLRGKHHVTSTFTLDTPAPSYHTIKQEPLQPSYEQHRNTFVREIAVNHFDEYRPTKRAKLGHLPQPSADILHDRELAAHWIARELVQFAQGFTISEASHSGGEEDEESIDADTCSLPHDVPGLERPDSSDSVDSFISTDSDRLLNNIQASFAPIKSSSGDPSPIQRPLPMARHPLSLFSPSLSFMQPSSAFRSISSSFTTNPLSLYSGTSATFASSLSFSGSSPSLYPQWAGSTSSAFTPLTSACFSNTSLSLGKPSAASLYPSSASLYPQPANSTASLYPQPAASVSDVLNDVPLASGLCPASSTAASVMLSLAFST